jgi:dienelactone hydrolase
MRIFTALLLVLAQAAASQTPSSDAPLRIERGSQRVFDGYSQTSVTFASPAGGEVPADIFESEPRAAAAVPAVIFVHGMPGSKDTMAPLAAAYARAGWVGLTLSAPFARAPAYRKDFSRLLPLMFDHHDRQEMIQMFQDVTRAVDVLQAHPRVDRTRIAFVGFSYGGSIGAWVAALEPRVRAVALMAPTSGIASWIRLAPEGHAVRGYFQEFPEAVRDTWLASMDSVEPWRFLAASDSRTPILIQAATRDGAVSAADTARLTTAAGSRATVLWYESGHILPPAAQVDQARYLARQLDANIDRFVPTRRRFAEPAPR